MVIRFFIKANQPANGQQAPTCGTLTLVDLAGSEKEQENPTKRGESEANGINVSLTHLNRLLLKMQNNKLDESDKRQSTLNMMLFDSLREDCGVTMVFCIHADRSTYQASKTTVNMAQRCKKIQRRKRIRHIAVGEDPAEEEEKVVDERGDGGFRGRGRRGTGGSSLGRFLIPVPQFRVAMDM